MTIVEAYQKWVRLAPFKIPIERRSVSYTTENGIKTFVERAHFNGECCNARSHWMRDPNDFTREIPRPDHEVCEREKAWRDYVRIRDGVH